MLYTYEMFENYTSGLFGEWTQIVMFLLIQISVENSL